MANAVIEKAVTDLRAIGAAVESEMKRLDELASANKAAEHMAQVMAGNLRELGQQADAAHEAVAEARQQTRDAQAEAKQILSEARAQASHIQMVAERQATEIVTAARLRIEQAHTRLAS
jgi:hypothetical protein